MSVIPEAAVVAGAIVGGLVVICAVAACIVFLVYRYRRRVPTADMQADLDMMPLEELEGDNHNRHYGSSVALRKVSMSR